MINFDETLKINHKPNWSFISDHFYRIFLIERSESGKTNTLLNLMNHQSDIEKPIYTSKIHRFKE